MLNIYKYSPALCATLRSASIPFNYSTYGKRKTIYPTVDLSYVSYEAALSDVENLPPLIILHGLLGSKSNWASIGKMLHKITGRKIITVDARNHGDSPHAPQHSYKLMVEDVVKLMKRLNICKASFLGHSMGGRTAMLMSLLYPDLVSSLIVGDISPLRTSPNVYFLMRIFEAMETISIPNGIPMSQARKVADIQLTPAVPDFAIRNFIITNLIQTEKKEYAWRVNVRVLRNNFKNIASFTRDLDGFCYPYHTLFIAGGNSDYVGRDELPRIRKLFPLAELTFIEGAGHWVHSEKPETFVKLTCDFLIKY